MEFAVFPADYPNRTFPYPISLEPDIDSSATKGITLVSYLDWTIPKVVQRTSKFDNV